MNNSYILYLVPFVLKSHNSDVQRDQVVHYHPTIFAQGGTQKYIKHFILSIGRQAVICLDRAGRQSDHLHEWPKKICPPAETEASLEKQMNFEYA